MKKATAIILIFFMSCQCLVKMGLITYYQLNKAYIAEVLCINREKPALECHGKCFLTKNLKKASQEKEKNLPVNQLQTLEVPAFLISTYFYVSLPQTSKGQKFSFFSDKLIPRLLSLGIFHPPQA